MVSERIFFDREYKRGYAVISTYQTARREYECLFGDIIHKGETYHRINIPAEDTYLAKYNKSGATPLCQRCYEGKSGARIVDIFTREVRKPHENWKKVPEGVDWRKFLDDRD